jgi:predicted DCC family thiol-disulfide oxidoreductase YuxK
MINARWPQLRTPSAEEMKRSLWWLEGPRHDAGAVAVARALSAAPAPWRFAGHVLGWAPVARVAAPVYSFVARHRHWLPGASAACRVGMANEP